jgi:hypothetical protein
MKVVFVRIRITRIKGFTGYYFEIFDLQYDLLTHIPHPKLSQIKKALKVVHNN